MTAQPRWWPLLSTNFLGVLNDNFLKTLACFVAVTWVGAEYEAPLVSVAAGSLVVPYVFLSPLAGRWSVIFNKIRVVRIAKFAEIPIMLLASAGFLLEHVWMVMIAILLMGTQSSLFSPSKYGLIRDIGGTGHIALGAGHMETVSFLGMILGTMLASFFAQSVPSWGLSLIFLFFASAGFASAMCLRARESLPETSPETASPLRYLIRSMGKAKRYKGLNSVVIALSVFWFVAAMTQMTLLVYCRRDLYMSDFQTGLVLTAAAVGTGAGCFLSGILAGKWNRKIFVPVCGTVIALLFLWVYFFDTGGFWFGALFFMTGLLCGLYKVPFDAAIIQKVPGRNLGHMLAYSNQISFIFILGASGAFALITKFTQIRAVFLFLGLLMGITTLFVVFSKYLWSTKQE